MTEFLYTVDGIFNKDCIVHIEPRNNDKCSIYLSNQMTVKVNEAYSVIVARLSPPVITTPQHTIVSPPDVVNLPFIQQPQFSAPFYRPQPEPNPFQVNCSGGC